MVPVERPESGDEELTADQLRDCADERRAMWESLLQSRFPEWRDDAEAPPVQTDKIRQFLLRALSDTEYAEVCFYINVFRCWANAATYVARALHRERENADD